MILPAIIYCGWFFGSQSFSNIALAPVYNSTFSLRTDNSSQDFVVDFGPEGFSNINPPDDFTANMGTENKVGKSLVFHGPETSVGFVRVRSFACIECACKGPLSSPQHMVGVETSQDGGFEDEIVSFDFPTAQPPVLFHITTQTSLPPVSEMTQSPYVVKITRSPVTTQSPVSTTTQSPTSATTQSPVSETTQSPVSETTLSSISRTTLSPNEVKIITETSQPPVSETTQPPASETTQPPVSETTQPPVSETTQPPFVIFANY